MVSNVSTRTVPVRTPVAQPARKTWLWPLLIALTALIVVVIVYPLGRTLFAALGLGGDSTVGRMVEVLTTGSTYVILGNTLVAVVLGTVLALALGAIFAWINERTDARMGFAARMLPLMPMFVPSIAGAIGWVFLASPKAGLLNVWLQGLLGTVGIEVTEGPLNIYSWPGLVFAYVLFLTPYAYLTISSGLQSLDPALEEASRAAGAGPLQTFWRITLPSLKPALGAAVLVTVTMGVAIFSIPLVIGTPAGIDVLPVEIVQLMRDQYPSDTGGALAMSLFVVVIVMLCAMAQRRMIAANAHATISGRAGNEAVVALGRGRWFARIAMMLFLVMTTVLPLGALVYVSFQPFWSGNMALETLTVSNYVGIFEKDLVWGGLKNSLMLAAVGATAAVALGVAVTFVISRYKTRLSKVVDVVVKLPSTLTHIVIALAFIVAFAGPPFGWSGTYFILALAYIVLYVPQATFYATAAYHQVGNQLTEASLVSGASDAQTMPRILVPLMAPGLIAGWSLLFVLMTGDITASAMLASTHTPVVGFVILDMWGAGSYPQLAALGVLMTVVSSSVVLLVMKLRDRYLMIR